SDGGANSRADADVLVIKDYPDNVAQIVKVLGELDVKPKQVLIEATVLQASLTETNQFGVDLTVLGDLAMSQFTSPLTALDELINGTVVPGTGGGAQGGVQSTPGGTSDKPNSGLKVGIISSNIAAFINAVDGVTNTTVLANPKILVLNRQKANVLIGGKVGYL